MLKFEVFNALRPYVEAVQYAGATFPTLRICYIPVECCSDVTLDDIALAQRCLDVLNAAIRADQLTFTPGLATLQAPDLQTSLQQLLPTIFDATGASTIATLLKELAAAPPATPRVPLSKVEAEEVVLVAAVRVALLPALPALALPALPPLAIVAGGGWQWFPPGFYVELTPAGSNAVIAAATAGAAALTPLLVPVLGVGAAGAAVIAAALALQVGAMKVAQAASVKGAIKIKITPQVPPLPPLIYPWPA